MREKQGIAQSNWYYAIDGQTHGPLDEEAVTEMIKEGAISSSAWIVAEGSEDWTPAENSVFARFFSVGPSEQTLPGPLIDDEVEPSPLLSDSRDKHSVAGLPECPASTSIVSRLRAILPFRLRWAVLAPLGMVLLAGVAWLVDHQEQRGTSTRRETERTTQDTSASTAASREPSKSAARTLVIKGLSIGMPGEEAAKNIALSGHGRIWTRPSTFVSGEQQAHGYDIVFNEEDDPKGPWTGQIWTDEKTDRVTVFFFRQELTDFLFNTADQSAKEFAQSFINSYGVPTLTRSEFSGKPGWTYKSPQGWTLWIMPDKTIDVSKTLARNFD